MAGPDLQARERTFAAGQASAGGTSRWTQWTGYAAFAWGTFFAAQHLYWAFSGRFELEQVGARSVLAPWTGLAAAVVSVSLFSILALFPLALIWPFRRIGRRPAQVLLLIAGYGAMILLTLTSFVFSFDFGLYPVYVCAIGGLVAFVRPRRWSVPHWMVLVATWALGVGMTLYGGAYVYAAFLQDTSRELLRYLLVGGANWTVEGLLFVATAWLAGRDSARVGGPHASTTEETRGGA